jgi:ribosomal protein S18 acetylase RimI-like enzyme
VSLYADYISERTNDSIIEIPQGFATYRLLNEKTCYIIDIYVIPEARQSKIASKLADEITSLAKAKGCTELIGTVVPSAKNSDTSIKVLQGYGMKLDSAQNDLIVFRKQI